MFKWVCANAPHVAVSFDLFGTLVDADRVSDPADAVASELSARDVTVPDDWSQLYRDSHVDIPSGAELSLVEHVRAALASRDVSVSESRARRAVLAAFETPVAVRPGAGEALAAASEYGPVGLLSNCSVPGLVTRTLERVSLDPAVFDAVVTSVDCGWRKPDPRAFQQIADDLDVSLDALVHVSDDPVADGGVTEAGGTALLLDEVPLTAIPAALDRRGGARGWSG